MAQEKYKKERRDKANMPGFARAMVVLSVVLIVFAMALHIPVYADQTLIVIVGVVALVAALIAAFAWDASRAFRSIVRGLLIAVPLAVIGFGVFCAIAESVYNPASDALENWILYGSLAAQFAHVVLVFMLPALVAAASFGARLDRVLLSVMAIVNALLTVFLTYYVSGVRGHFDFRMENPIIHLVYVLFAFAFAALTFVPAIGTAEDHRLTVKKL